jgi:TPR repeat protein
MILVTSNAFGYGTCKDLVTAAWSGEYNKVKSLIEQGVNINCEYKNKSPLFAASRFGRQLRWDDNIEIVKLLVNNGANIQYKSIQNNEVLSSVYIAALYHHLKTALFLVQHGANLQDLEKGYIDRLNKEKNSSLGLELISSLLASGFNIPKDNKVSNGYKKFKNKYMEEMSSLAEKEITIADKYYDEKNFKLAFFWFEAAVKWNNPYAKYSLAYMYFYGNGIKKDLKKAQVLLENTTEPDGINILGLINSKQGNHKKASYFLKKAAKKNNSDSQFFLGLTYLSGKRYLSRNSELGYAWLIIASENGNSEAKKFLKSQKLNYENNDKIKNIINSLKKEIML